MSCWSGWLLVLIAAGCGGPYRRSADWLPPEEEVRIHSDVTGYHRAWITKLDGEPVVVDQWGLFPLRVRPGRHSVTVVWLRIETEPNVWKFVSKGPARLEGTGEMTLDFEALPGHDYGFDWVENEPGGAEQLKIIDHGRPNFSRIPPRY